MLLTSSVLDTQGKGLAISLEVVDEAVLGQAGEAPGVLLVGLSAFLVGVVPGLAEVVVVGGLRRLGDDGHDDADGSQVELHGVQERLEEKV